MCMYNWTERNNILLSDSNENEAVYNMAVHERDDYSSREDHLRAILLPEQFLLNATLQLYGLFIGDLNWYFQFEQRGYKIHKLSLTIVNGN